MSSEPPVTQPPATAEVPGPATGAVPVQPSGAGRLGRHTSVLLVSGFATVVLAAMASLVSVPYAVIRPGPAINTLGSQGGKQLISVTGHPTYPTTGSLDLTTVTVSGGPVSKVTLLDLLLGVGDSSVDVVREDDLFPPGQTSQESKRENQREMATSQEQATAAALGELGIRVPATVTIAETEPKSPAADLLRAGDVLVSVGATRIEAVADVRTALQKVTSGASVAVAVRRGGSVVTLEVPTRSVDGRTVLGVYLDPAFHFPFSVKIQIDDVGGPSAGMMFALGIIDVLTPGSLAGGQQVAGTGTIDSEGNVGPIGGIQQKMIGARRAGAAWFLSPTADCPDVVGNIPDGLRVVKVSTLHDARTALAVIASGTGTQDLPTCTAG